jgi:glycosyltransferase involved in cell wall biosynthesis
MFRDLGGGLAARGHRVRLLTSHPGRPARAAEGGIEIVRAWRPPDGRLRRRAFEDHLTHVPASYLALRRGDDDVAHASHAPDAVAAARWARRAGRPAVFSFMGIPERRWLVARRVRLEAMVHASGGCEPVALSAYAAGAWRRSLGVDARVIHPGVDLRAFSPGGERAEPPTVLCVAPPEVAEKRVGLLVEALPIVRRERPSARLVLQRPPDPALAARLAGAGAELMDRDPALLPGAYRAAWVSALASSAEAFGLVLAESLACGTPVVGARAGAIPEVIGDAPVGALFDVAEPAAVARALLDGLDLAAQPGSAEACRRRAEDFSIERCVEAYEALYRELAAEG